MGGRAIAQAVSHRLPTVAARVQSQVMWDLWWTKWHWVRFPPSTSVSPVNSHSTDCSTLIIRVWYNRPNSGRRTKCTQSHPTPKEIKKIVKWDVNLRSQVEIQRRFGRRYCLHSCACRVLLPCLASSSTLNMESLRHSEKSVCLSHYAASRPGRRTLH
jgi:hypothetical protein